MGDALALYVESILGPDRVIDDRSWGHGDTWVGAVCDGTGQTWFVKQHSDEARYRRELAAYRAWVSAFGDRAPALRSHNDTLRALILSAVVGSATDGCDANVQRQAGALLRRLHEVAAPVRWDDFAAVKYAEFEHCSVKATGLIAQPLLDFARSAVRALAELPAPLRIPCHLDYSSRNWLVDGGRLGIIDFEWAAPEVWVNDLARLYFGAWRDRPDLRDAFLAGYGRAIDGEERAILHGCGALRAVWQVVWAHDHGDAPFEAASRQNLQWLMEGRFS